MVELVFVARGKLGAEGLGKCSRVRVVEVGIFLVLKMFTIEYMLWMKFIRVG